MQMKTSLLPNASKPALLATLVAGALGIAPSAMAAFLVAEMNTGKAELYNATGTHLSTFASGLSAPIGVAEGGGSVFISSYGNDMINKYTPGGTSQGVVNSGAAGHGPTGLAYINGRIHGAAYNIGYLTSSAPDAVAEDGNPGSPSSYLYYSPGTTVHGVASAAPNGFTDIVYYTATVGGTGEVGYWQPGVAAGTVINLGTVDLRGVVAAGSSTLYVAEFSANKIVKVYFDGIGWVSSDFITGINTPVGVAIDGGNLYVSSFDDKTITGYSLGDASQVSQFTTLSNPQYFAITSIPEPASFGLLAAGALLVIRRRRQV
jgi:hypothetical protein